MLDDKQGGTATGNHPGKRLTTHWHGPKQPPPTHSHASTLHGLTCMLWDPGDLAGWGIPHITSSKDHRAIPAVLGGSAARLDLGAERGEGRHGMAMSHKGCSRYWPREEEGRQLSPWRSWAQPRGF